MSLEGVTIAGSDRAEVPFALALGRATRQYRSGACQPT
jgi:hypothetical protein